MERSVEGGVKMGGMERRGVKRREEEGREETCRGCPIGANDC